MWFFPNKRRVKLLSLLVFGLHCFSILHAETVESQGGTDVEFFVDWLLKDPERLDSISFAEVVEATSGKRLLAVDGAEAVDAEMLGAVEAALIDCLEKMNTAEHSIHGIARINEVSRPIEDFLMQALDAMDGLTCAVPLTAEGDAQRSGYPDLRLVHDGSGRVFYIDPKVYKQGSERSGFRTFYFEPKLETNKILDDASHLIVGIAHSGKVNGRWGFEGWQIVDLAEFRVRLKAEFQASNKELYKESAVLRSSRPGR